MIEIETIRKIALSFVDATEEPHLEKTSFRIRKRIFLTLDHKIHQAVVKLSEIDQSIFCTYDESIIHPVSGAWGRQGWTKIELSHIPEEMLKDAIRASYCQVAPKKLANQYNHQSDSFDQIN